MQIKNKHIKWTQIYKCAETDKIIARFSRMEKILQSLFMCLGCRVFENVLGCGKSLDSSFLVCPAWILSMCLSHWLQIRLVRLVPNARRTLTD